jgi:hypothetical protein
MKHILLAFVFFLSTNAFADVEYYCEALVQNQYFTTLTAEINPHESRLVLVNPNKSGAPDRFVLSADRSIEDGTIFYTSDESVLIIETTQPVGQSHKVSGVYMIPPIRIEIPVACEPYL